MNKIKSEKEFQEEVQRIHDVLRKENMSILRLYDFAKNQNTHRKDTIVNINESNNRTCTQLGFLDTSV